MNSKSILLLGIVFVFLLNVIAVHDYIDNSYYNSYHSDKSVEKKIVKPKKTLKQEKIVKKEQVAPKSKKLSNEDITLYKSLLLSSTKEEKNYTSKLQKNKKSTNDTKNKKKLKANQENKNIIIELELDIENSYQKENPIIKKIAQGLDKNKTIVIKIYQFNSQIKKYVKYIKDDLVSNEIDVDDIKVIYNKTEQKNKNKIKILLLKKD